MCSAKRLLSLILVLLIISPLTLSLFSCRGSNSNGGTDTNVSETPDETPDQTLDEAPNNNAEDPDHTTDSDDSQTPDQPTDGDDFYTLEAKSESRAESSIPNFTEKQIKIQKMKGADLADQISEAAKDLSKSSFTIPAGYYGFEMNSQMGALDFPYGFALFDIQRPDDNPFTIYAEGATFWVEPTGRPIESASYAFLIHNCSNIKVVGLTIDEYDAHDIEGYVTDIDKANNRIAIKLSNSSLDVTDEVMDYVKSAESRIVPFKASGEHIAPLYRINPKGWGPGATLLSSIEPTGNEGEYWLKFKTDLMVKTITDSRWKKTYGSMGIIEEGDVISVLYAQNLFNLSDSKQITIEGLKDHLTIGMPGEDGGYGAHVWKDCYFGPRPGTSKVMTAGEYMFCGTRVGTTLDNVYIASSSDDEINIHGYWCEPYRVSGSSMKLRYLHNGLIAGDIAEFYSSDGTLVATRKLASDPVGEQVTFTESAPNNATSLKVRFPALECNGWTIKNCTFVNNYQRILIQSGTGTFENNKILNMGLNMSVSNTYNYLEGGVLGDITFKNNVFYNCSNSPETYLFDIAQNHEWDAKIIGGKIDISDNLFINCGYAFTAKNIEALTVKDNIFINPITHGDTVTTLSQLIGELKNVAQYSLSGNTFYSSKARKNIDENGNRDMRIDSELASRAGFYAANSDKDAISIIEIIKNNLSKG